MKQLLRLSAIKKGVFFGGIVLAIGLVFYALQSQNNSLEQQDSSRIFSQKTLGIAQVKPQESISLKNGDTYTLIASIVKKKINGHVVKMLAYNGSIPGPLIKVPQGAEITVNFKNDTDVDSTLHSHGVRVENKFDGTPDVTQKGVKPGESFIYILKFPDAGIYWYHPHVREDYAQELGLYGNFLVTPTQKDYWAEVDREETLFLDDIALVNGQIAPFNKSTVDHTLMGRFGNVMLINGSDAYKLSVKQGERVRFYLTNSASTRVFNISIPNARMKLVGADNGKYEREEWVDAVLIAPSERQIVEVWFDQSGEYQILHKTPEKTYTMGRIAVEQHSVTTSYLMVPRVNQDIIDALSPFRQAFTKPVDQSLTFSLAMGMMDSSGSQGGHGGHGGSMMNEDATTPVEETAEKIEWEDDMGMMNLHANTNMMKWKFIDDATKKENMDINWQFKKGDIVKVKLFNDPNNQHPMQHPIHIHGQRFLVVSTNGISTPNLVWKDTVLVQTGDTVELLVAMENPGDWMIHCHIPEHMEAGMMAQFAVI